MYILLLQYYLCLILVPVEEPSCKDDANACAANNNGKTACFNGECVGK